MKIRLLAAVALAITASPANAEGWLLSVDIPATAGGQFVAAGQVVRIDDGAASPVAVDAGLPPGTAAASLASDADGRICWSVGIPVELPDGQFARPDEIYCHDAGTYTRIFRGGDFGLQRSISVGSIGWNDAGELHLSFSIPAEISATLVGAGALVRVDGSSLIPVADLPELPARTVRSAATFNEQDHPVLALSTPAMLAGTLGRGLVLLVNDAGSVSSDDSLAVLFDDAHRIGLAGLHRLIPAVVEDLLFSDRFESP